MGNRKAAEAVVIKMLEEIDPTSVNTELTKTMYAKMDDAQFEKYVTAIKNGEDFVAIVMENLTGNRITVRNNLEVAKKWGHNFFQRLWLTDQATGSVYLTGPEYLLLHLPVRIQIQTLANKISIPEDNKHVDELTDQPTGVSKGSSISFPETLVLYAQGFEKSILELIKFRGGDIPLMNEMDKLIHQTGGASLDSLSRSATKVKSTQTLSTLLKTIHFDNNF